ncbi:hypothetical protein SCHPADRAFT_896409 [Schizopora paradoxa]|uniref:Uncharacterized protein n=1 Tax=Schizopora paradoxa TaxID=27342 RepID=A0A0H2R6Y7_9AGAM|nr:hypothetical protein SCHPADRAFT_896409 [Schizopora paradoxa]
MNAFPHLLRLNNATANHKAKTTIDFVDQNLARDVLEMEINRERTRGGEALLLEDLGESLRARTLSLRVENTGCTCFHRLCYGDTRMGEEIEFTIIGVCNETRFLGTDSKDHAYEHCGRISVTGFGAPVFDRIAISTAFIYEAFLKAGIGLVLPPTLHRFEHHYGIEASNQCMANSKLMQCAQRVSHAGEQDPNGFVHGCHMWKKNIQGIAIESDVGNVYALVKAKRQDFEEVDVEYAPGIGMHYKIQPVLRSVTMLNSAVRLQAMTSHVRKQAFVPSNTHDPLRGKGLSMHTIERTIAKKNQRSLIVRDNVCQVQQQPEITKDIPAFVQMLADTIRDEGSKISYDEHGCLVMGTVDVAVIALSDFKPTFYAKHPMTRSRVLEALPSLYDWMKVAARWLEFTSTGAGEILGVREHICKNVARAITIMVSVGEEGSIFMRERQVQNLAIDLWVRSRGQSVLEEESLALAVVKCKNIMSATKDDDAFRNDPREFTKTFMDRCKARFDLNNSDVMKIARDKFDRALHPGTSRVQEGRDFYLSLQLAVLSMVINNSASTFRDFVRGDGVRDICRAMNHAFSNSLWCLAGHSIDILARVCLASQTTDSIISALRNRLIKSLICGTLHYTCLEEHEAEGLLGIIGQRLPEALIIRDVFLQCGDMEVDENCRKKLCSHPVLGDRWEHLFRVYNERHKVYNIHLPVRHELRRCFNTHKKNCVNAQNGSSGHDLNARELKSLMQLALHQARPSVYEHLGNTDTYTDIIVHVQYRDSFRLDAKGSEVKIEVTGNITVEGHADRKPESLPCVLKVTYVWNNEERTVHFDTFV